MKIHLERENILEYIRQWLIDITQNGMFEDFQKLYRFTIVTDSYNFICLYTMCAFLFLKLRSETTR